MKDLVKGESSNHSHQSILWHRSYIHFVNSNVNAVDVRSKKTQREEKLDTKKQDFVC